jgi:hypothetical protein
MSGGEDWVMRPVLRGMVSLESIFEVNGPLDLHAMAIANEALDVEAANNAIVEDHIRKQR